MIRDKTPFKPLYPDVIGAITGGRRINMEDIEVALGMFPSSAYINQPIEVVLVMQNMVDQPVQAKVAIRLPTADRKGNIAVIETAKAQVNVNLEPGEVSVLRMPVVSRPPTQAGKEFPVRVAIRYRVKDKDRAHAVRPPGGGAPPSVLSISPYKLQVLRDVKYGEHKWNDSTDILTTYFDLAPKVFPNTGEVYKASLESLWTQSALKQEIQAAKEFEKEAMELAKTAAYGSAFPHFMDAVEHKFASRDMPLMPGEVRAIAKIMTYTVDDAVHREPDLIVENTRWYRAMCQVLAHDPTLLEIDRNVLITQHVFEPVMYESILLAFKILQSRVRENLGTRDEQINYANRVMTWFSGHGEADLSYVYLPLVLCGLVAARWVKSTMMESPWDIIDELIEAYQARSRLIAGATDVVFDMLDELVEKQTQTLKLQRVERPRRLG